MKGKVAIVAGAGKGIGASAVIPIGGGQSAGVKPPQMYRQGERMQAVGGRHGS